jgi:prolyl oligopeptidase
MSKRHLSLWSLSVCGLLAVACERADTQNPCETVTADGPGAIEQVVKASPWSYPRARVSPQVDDLHGVGVSDPYRWLENLDSDETRAWVEAENQVTFAYLEKIAARAPIQAKLEQLWNFERYGTPARHAPPP